MMELNFKTNDIAFEVKEHVAYILLNKPEQYNPISAEAMQDLSQCLTYCEEHDDVRAVVIRRRQREGHEGTPGQRDQRDQAWYPQRR